MLNKNEISLHGAGSLPQYEFDGDDYDRYYLPARGILRAIADQRQGKQSHLILPGSFLDETVEFLDNQLNISADKDNKLSDRIFKTPDQKYLLWEDVLNNLPELLFWLQQAGLEHMLISLLPYASSADYWQVYDRLSELGFEVSSNMDRLGGEQLIQDNCFAHKGAYFEWIYNPKSIEQMARFPEITRPSGYIARNGAEAIEALNLLEQQNANQAIIFKQIYAGGGYGIDFFDSIKDAQQAIESSSYSFEAHPYVENANHPILIQEKINIVRDEMGEVGISVQFEGKNILGLTRTLADNHGHWSGNLLIDAQNSQAAGIPPELLANAKAMSQVLLNEIGPQGKGGIDFVISEIEGNLELNFMEVNGGRTTGAEEAVQFSRILGEENKGVVGLHKYSIDKNLNLTINDVAELIAAKNLLFSFDQNTGEPQFGLLPIACIGDHLTLVGYGENHQELYKAFKALT